MSDRPARKAAEDSASSAGRTGHPPGLYLLFVAEMWERFSYYGMKAFLTLYMIATLAEGGLGWSKEDAANAFGWYTGLVYLTPIFGGYLADKFIGTHWAMIIGGLLIAAGHFTLAFETLPSFFGGLVLIILGTGLFKPCVSVMVSQLYPERDPRRDSAFTIFYMGINLGAFLGPIICGGLRVGQRQGEAFGWSYAFAAAGVGMVLGLIAYLIGRPFVLRGIGLPPKERGNTRGLATTAGILLVLAVAVWGLYQYDGLASLGRAWAAFSGNAVAYWITTGVLAAVVLAGIAWFVASQAPADRGPVASIFIMSFFVIFFWTAFEQAGSSMTFFAEERTDRSIAPDWAVWLYRAGVELNFPYPWWVFAGSGAALLGGWIWLENARSKPLRRHRLLAVAVRVLGLAAGPLLLMYGALKPGGLLKAAFFPDDFVERAQYPPDWFQSVNPFCILLLAPLFSALWLWLGRRGREPSTPVKFSLGLILLGLGFLFMVFGAHSSESGSSVIRVSGWWLLAAYSIHTIGELCLSPVGLSMVTKLAPVRFASLLMGVWFMAFFVANKTAGTLAGKVEKIEKQTLHFAGMHLTGQTLFFSIFVALPVAAGLVLLAVSPVLKRLMQRRA